VARSPPLTSIARFPQSPYGTARGSFAHWPDRRCL